MSPDSTSLGACPQCHTVLRPAHVLIEYEKDGEQSMYADCPKCQDPVRPTDPN